MFSESLFQRERLELERTLGRPLIIYPPDYCRTCVDVLDQLVDPQGPVRYNRRTFLKRPLRQDELDFIENERLLCSLSFSYWCARYAWIVSTLLDENESVVLFTPTVAQQMFLGLCAEREELGLYILLMVLKARQLGSSSLCAVIIAYKVLFKQYINALLGSSDPDKSKKMAAKMAFVWERTPWWMKPDDLFVAESRELMCRVPSQQNYVTIQHGTQMSAIGRGDTITDFLLSEIPDYANPWEDIDASLMKAVHPHPNTFGVLESTAKGTVGYWPSLWKNEIRRLKKGRQKFYPLFFSWFLGSDLYPTRNWLRANPIPQKWKPRPDTLAHAKMCERYAHSDPLYIKHLGQAWRLPREQAWYYECEYAYAKEDDDPGALARFLEEMPATPEEAFQASGWGIFKKQFIDKLRKEARPLADYHGRPAIFRLSCPELDEEFPIDWDEIDQSRPSIELAVDLRRGRSVRSYRLLPIRPYNLSLSEGLGHIYIYEFPIPGQKYGLGCDTSRGLKQDRTALEILKKGDPLTPYEQVLEFADDEVDSNFIEYYCDALGWFYSTYSALRRMQCKLVLEIAEGGYNLQHQLKLKGWSNFHDWEGKYDTAQRRIRRDRKIGWETNSYTRDMLITEAKAGLLRGHLIPNSPWIISEIQTLRKAEDSERVEAEASSHDDRVFAIGFVYLSMSIWEGRKALNEGRSLFEQGGSSGSSGMPIAIPEPSEIDPASLLPLPGERRVRGRY